MQPVAQCRLEAAASGDDARSLDCTRERAAVDRADPIILHSESSTPTSPANRSSTDSWVAPCRTRYRRVVVTLLWTLWMPDEHLSGLLECPVYEDVFGVRQITDDFLHRLGGVCGRESESPGLVSTRKLWILEQVENFNPVLPREMLFTDLLEIRECLECTSDFRLMALSATWRGGVGDGVRTRDFRSHSPALCR
jgi:hypothetical protein